MKLTEKMLKKNISAILLCSALILGSRSSTWGCDQIGNGKDGTGLFFGQNGLENSTFGDSDPIDMASGLFTGTRTDVTLPGPMPITYTRTFARGGTVGAEGTRYGRIGWTDNCHKCLTFGTEGAGYYRGDGVCIPILFNNVAAVQNSTTGVVATLGNTTQYPFYSLTYNGHGVLVVTDKSGNSEYYQMNGYNAVITKAVDRYGNEIDYSYYIYPATGYYAQLTSVSDPKSGRYLNFNYAPGTFALTSITDSFGRTVNYEYSTALSGGDYRFYTKVTLPPTPDCPSGTTESYQYDHDYNISDIIDGNGNDIVHNVFAPNINGDRVTQQTVNGVTGYLSYDDTNKEITFTDYNGNSTDYYNDGYENLVRTVVHTRGLHATIPSGTVYETDDYYGTRGDGPKTGPGPKGIAPDNCYKTEEIDPSGNTTNWQYDDFGDVLAKTPCTWSGQHSRAYRRNTGILDHDALHL